MKNKNSTAAHRTAGQARIIAITAGLTAIIAVIGISAVTLAGNGNYFKHKMNLDPEKRAEMQANHEAMKKALEVGDYEAWKALMGDKPMADKMSEEDFNKLKEVTRFWEAGEKEAAIALKKELSTVFSYGHMKVKGDGEWDKKGWHKFVDEDGDGQRDYKK